MPFFSVNCREMAPEVTQLAKIFLTLDADVLFLSFVPTSIRDSAADSARVCLTLGETGRFHRCVSCVRAGIRDSAADSWKVVFLLTLRGKGGIQFSYNQLFYDCPSCVRPSIRDSAADFIFLLTLREKGGVQFSYNEFSITASVVSVRMSGTLLLILGK